MKSIGRKEIKEALDNINLDKKQYNGWQIDSMILNYYDLPKNISLEDVTEVSNEFENITVVYEYIDDLLNKKGYFTIDLYIRSDK